MSDLIIQQGTDSGFRWPITDDNGVPIELVGWIFDAQVRNIRDNIVHEWNEEQENIIIEDGAVTLRWTSEDSKTWKWTEGRYDLEATLPNGLVVRLDQGFISVAKEVTR